MPAGITRPLARQAAARHAAPSSEEYADLKAHAARWQAKRRELQATCGAAGLHAYVPAFGDVIDTRACRLCNALEPRK